MSSGVDTARSAATGGATEAFVPQPRAGGTRSAAGEPDPRSRRWQRRLVRLAIATDVIIVLVVAALAVVGRVHDPSLLFAWSNAVRQSTIGVLFLVGGLVAFRVWEPGVLGQGSEEFNRVLRGVAAAVVALALSGMALKANEVRPWVFGVLPITGVALILGRYGLRRALHHQRREHQRCMSPVLAIGSEEAIADLAARTLRVPHHGWLVVAACTSTGPSQDGAHIDGVPVVGDLDDVVRHVHELGIEVVAVTPTPGWTPKRLHRLAWDLEGYGVELVVDPGLMEITGPRLHVAPVDGLPLLRLTEPRWGGPARMIKNVCDRAVALGLVMLLAPLLLAVAILVKRDGGPVFYRSERIGRAGAPFRMIKFRTMVVGADRQIGTLNVTSDGAGPMFKMRKDPRLTRIGGVLRRFSLDELPQLFNVAGGSMSLVGPRPPLECEVATYADDARRKLLVRPGMTGLWQISGRSDLSWEESVRLDLRYVENWTPFLDISILWKTFGAVFRGRGAY